MRVHFVHVLMPRSFLAVDDDAGDSSGSSWMMMEEDGHRGASSTVSDSSSLLSSSFSLESFLCWSVAWTMQTYKSFMLV